MEPCPLKNSAVGYAMNSIGLWEAKTFHIMSDGFVFVNEVVSSSSGIESDCIVFRMGFEIYCVVTISCVSLAGRISWLRTSTLAMGIG